MPTDNISLYTKHNINTLHWPVTPNGQFARQYLLPLIKNGIASYIKNVCTDLRVLKIGNVILPVTITNCCRHNSYVCSPYNHYFAYGQQEFGNLQNPLLEALLRAVVAPFARYYRRNRFDDVVLVNNWLLSTNLYPRLDPSYVRTITAFLAAQFPDRPIIFRSIDSCGNRALYQQLPTQGYHMVFSRQVYYQQPNNPALWRKKQIKVDQRLLRRTPYQLAEHIDPASASRIAKLYRLLYIDKYSSFNPRFTPKFFKLALTNHLFTFKAFQKLGDIDAVMGYYTCNGIMTQPIFGYDTALPQKLGLYRLLSMQVLLEGQKQALRVNASAGVGQFKRLRGGVPVIEYNAVYLRHLPAHRQRLWFSLKALLNRVAIPVIKKYGF